MVSFPALSRHDSDDISAQLEAIFTFIISSATMSIKMTKLWPSLLLAFGVLTTYGQVSTVGAGGDASSTSGSVSYSVGQVFFSSQNGSNGSLVQGVQQVYEIAAVGIKNPAFDISMAVFPNPTAHQLTLSVDTPPLPGMEYQLYDLQGRLLGSAQIKETETSISFSAYAKARYTLTITHENVPIQSFSILKN